MSVTIKNNVKKMSGLVCCFAGSVCMSNVAQAGNVEISGFADIIYVLSDGINDTPPGTDENRFDVSAEVDLISKINESMNVRIDVDLNTQSSVIGGGDSSRIEQAFFDWSSSGNLTVKGGVFNNPLGWEAEDAPDLYQISHGQLYNIWDAVTDFSGNNVAGVEVSAYVGPVQITGALLNDLGNVTEEQSLMGFANYMPKQVPGLTLEAGFVTQDTGLETIIDVNATFKMSQFIAGVELMLPAENIDFAVAGTGSYTVTDQIAVTARFDHVSYDLPLQSAIGDAISITLAASYMLDKNLVTNVELRINDSDFKNANATPSGGCGVVACDGEIIQLEVIARF